MAHRPLQLFADESARCVTRSRRLPRGGLSHESHRHPSIWRAGGAGVRGLSGSQSRRRRSAGAGGRRQHQSDRHHGALGTHKGLQASPLSRCARVGFVGDGRRSRAGSRSRRAGRQGACVGVPHLRRALLSQGGASRQRSPRPRPCRSRRIAAGHDHGRRAHFCCGRGRPRPDRARFRRVRRGGPGR